MPERKRLPNWRWEALRTTLWFLPTVLIGVAALVFFATIKIDIAAFLHQIQLPTWLRSGTSQASG